MALTMRDVDEFRKVCFVGLATVGKSTLSDRIAKPEYKFNPSRRETNRLDFNTIKVNADGKGYALQVWDIAGAELGTDNESLGGYLKSANQIVVCFDSTVDHQSAQGQVHTTLGVVQNLVGREIPITLIGCKSDESDETDNWAGIVTSVQEEFYEGKSIPLFLCSARDNKISQLNPGNSLVETTFGELCASLARTSLKPASTSSTLALSQSSYGPASPPYSATLDTRHASGDIQNSSGFFGRLFCCLRDDSNNQTGEDSPLLGSSAPPTSRIAGNSS